MLGRQAWSPVRDDDGGWPTHGMQTGYRTCRESFLLADLWRRGIDFTQREIFSA
jgi:hypothetical protein